MAERPRSLTDSKPSAVAATPTTRDRLQIVSAPFSDVLRPVLKNELAFHLRRQLDRLFDRGLKFSVDCSMVIIALECDS